MTTTASLKRLLPTRRLPRIKLRPRRLLRLAVLAVILLYVAEIFRVTVGPNLHTVVEGRVYRSAQLSPGLLDEVIREKGIRTVVNLRGCCKGFAWYDDECRVTHGLGVNQEDITLSANRLPPPSELRRLVEVFDNADGPFLMHCRRGADRTGLASAVVQLLYTDASHELARWQCSPRFGHVGVGSTAYMDEFFTMYRDYLRDNGLSHTRPRFRHWLLGEYCPGPCRADLSWARKPAALKAGEAGVFALRAVNRSPEAWHFRPGTGDGVHAFYRLSDAAGVPILEGRAGLFRRTVWPGGDIELALALPPLRRPGGYVIHVDFVDGRGNSFTQAGSEPLLANFAVTE